MMNAAETQHLLNAANVAFQGLQENNASFVDAVGGLLALSQNSGQEIFTPNPLHENIDLELENLANEINIPNMEEMAPEHDGGDEPMDTRPDFEELPDILPGLEELLTPLGDGLPLLSNEFLIPEDGIDFSQIQQELEEGYSDQEDPNIGSLPQEQNVDPNENEDELYWNDIALEFQEYAEDQGLYENEANLNNETVQNIWTQYLNQYWDPDWHERIVTLGEHCAWFGVFPNEN